MKRLPVTPRTPSASTHILLVSDTHGRLHPEILALAEKVDIVIHAGDIGHPDILALLARPGRRMFAVQGNNDTRTSWPSSAYHQLAQLDRIREVTLAGDRIAVEHGDRVNPANRRHALLRARYPEARLVVYGHSHRQVIDTAERPWVVNPGAAGRSRTFGGSGCILLTVTNQRWHLRPFQFPLANWKS